VGRWGSTVAQGRYGRGQSIGLLSMPSVYLYYISKQLILRIVTMISEVLIKGYQGFIEVLAIMCPVFCAVCIMQQ
jgi:hypothetical protein